MAAKRYLPSSTPWAAPILPILQLGWSSDIEKKARKLRRAVRKGLVDDATEKEGETYAAGAF